MEQQQHQNITKYISQSKKTIDHLISNNKYKDAFQLLILVLSKLDEKNIHEFIEYYDNMVFTNTTINTNTNILSSI